MRKFIKYLWQKNNTLPIHLIFEVTSICNSKCATCFNWKKTNAKQLQLSLEQTKTLLSSFEGHRLLWLSFTGGECFLRKDLVELFSLFVDNIKPAFFSIPTNGLLPDVIISTVEKMLKLYKNPFVVTLSLDGLESVHDKIRGVSGNFKKCIETYAGLSQLKQLYPNLHIGINTVLNSLNQHQLREIINFVKNELKPESHTIEFMRGCSRNSAIQAPSLNYYADSMEIIKSALKNKSYYKFNPFAFLLKSSKIYYHDLAYATLKQKRQVIPCFAGRLSAVIDCRGDVYPCELYKKFGSLQDFDFNFKRLWFSENANQTRDKIKKGACYCTHSCFQFMNILFNPKVYPMLIKKAIF